VEQHNKFAAPFVFGCLVSEEGHFKLQYADGIMGLSMYTQTLVGEWSRHGSIAQNSFSLCLSREGGHISIGGTGLSHDRPSKQNGRPVYGKINLSPMRFTPFAKLNVWYFSVTVTSISVGAVVLPNRILQFYPWQIPTNNYFVRAFLLFKLDAICVKIKGILVIL
jgi:hypothetical protein